VSRQSGGIVRSAVGRFRGQSSAANSNRWIRSAVGVRVWAGQNQEAGKQDCRRTGFVQESSYGTDESRRPDGSHKRLRLHP
jgi:hypothetical protein